jgi:hypothetical protein
MYTRALSSWTRTVIEFKCKNDLVPSNVKGVIGRQ